MQEAGAWQLDLETRVGGVAGPLLVVGGAGEEVVRAYEEGGGRP